MRLHKIRSMTEGGRKKTSFNDNREYKYKMARFLKIPLFDGHKYYRGWYYHRQSSDNGKLSLKFHDISSKEWKRPIRPCRIIGPTR